MRIEQFVYTTAEIDGRLGYQAVARSKGITDEIVSNMYGYMHPAGIDPSDFEESRSMRLLDGGLVVYCIAKNAGIGHDGRPHTLYCHAFVVREEEFIESGYDTRVLDALYVEDKAVRGTLPTMSLDLPPLPIRHGSTGEHDLGEALDPLFRGKSVAWIGGGRFLQDVLRMLPVSLRLVPFSTLVLLPDRQPEYRLIACPEIVKYRLPKSFATMPGVNVPSKDVSHYAQLVASGRHDRVARIQQMFDEQGVSMPGGLGLACDREMYAMAPGPEKPDIAGLVLDRIWGLDNAGFLKYLGEIGGSLNLGDPPGGWAEIPNPRPRAQNSRPGWTMEDHLSWILPALFDPDDAHALQRHHMEWLKETSKTGGRPAIRFTYEGHPRIVIKFKLANGVLRGIQVGGESGSRLPREAVFHTLKIRNLEVAAGRGRGPGIRRQSKIPAFSRA